MGAETGEARVTVKLVLLDLVGTLLDEASDYDALDGVMKLVVERFRLDAKPKELSGEFSLALMEILRGEPDLEEPADFVPFEKAAKDIFAAILEFRGFKATPEDVAWFWSSYLQIQKKTWRLFPEAKKALKDLKDKGFRIGIVTDSDRYLAAEILPALRLNGLVDFVVCAEEVGFVKPHPAIFERALATAGVAPEEAVMVGDSYERDVLGARGAGVGRAILVDRHRARTVDVPTLPGLKRLPKLLAQWAPPAPSTTA
jgi:HAD superfamily hydrolase (TIGR01549 family)